MIGKLTGTIISAKPSEVIIDVNGVGYRVSIPLSTFSSIAGKKQVSLDIHTHVREDQIRLFGFHRLEDRELFETLIQISGIGPSIALSLLSGMSSEELIESVRSGKTAALERIPGIGKSKAEKLIFELARKLKTKPVINSDSPRSEYDDAIEALMSLGFDEKRSAAAVKTATGGNDGIPLEEVIKKSLEMLSSDIKTLKK
ncbi:MAG TPA: Holliday junction branch migration protein RuvA [Spirochaetota bacterium]|nr:Holliday junction branch migration protein RuvA [Spirochaetota bacterium]